MKFASVLMIVNITAGCAVTRAPSDRMLDARSDYKSDKPLEVEFIPTEQKVAPKRSAAVTADIWVHPHEMGPGDYFLGGWMRTVVKEPHWSHAEGVGKAFKAKTKTDPEPKKEQTLNASKKF